MTHVRRPYFVLTAALAVPFFATPALAEGVPAGTLIENTAVATYDAGDGPETIDSNTVVLRVDELLDVTVASLNAGPVATSSGGAVLTYSVTNTGNGPEAFTLTVNPAVGGNDFDPTVDGIAVDTNGNGVYDPGVDDILTSPETTEILDPDEALTVFVLLSVPPTAADEDEAQVDLLAEAVTGTGTPGTTFAGVGEGGGDAVVGPTGADDNALGTIIVGITTVDLVKSAIVRDPFGGTSVVPGSIIQYTIRADVTGSGSVDDLLITDPIPTNTTYVVTSLTLDGGALTDGADGDAGEASDGAGITVDLGTVNGGTSHSITFDVQVDQ
ncbi:DUF11 domain-containing protein [Pontixanthobacter aestiaquae]|uniref:DUF11 domain-containing protein n=1 Tax=Pontixanthobacter aestiaquae TaxID=1509367 RepID=A0A844Z8P3_9SPHN|nr:DUF11 domain-containing protein [Pontixanthobacter aestiaquae]MDN3645679.1 DUF11 domain-containing protein [Pontixanthobacter aestiaquae]MXO83323.1 DUF11 domain-containing protein [Pontixanthobacter aestiaquae]